MENAIRKDYESLPGFDWNNAEIEDYFNSHWDLLLSDLARMTGKTVKELKRILLK